MPIPGTWPPAPTTDELTIAGLSSDGRHVRGWVKVPAGAVWRPEDLMWLPPSAAKSTDLDRAGEIVDVTLDPGETMAWVTAELNKRERYLELLRSKVRSGAMRLTSFLAKASAAMKAASDLQAMIDATGRRVPDDGQIKAIAIAAAERYASTGDMAAAMDAIHRAISASRKALPIDADTGLPIVGSS